MSVLRGKLIAFDAGTYLATVRLSGSGAQSLASVPVSRAIPSGEMTPGREVLVHLDRLRSVTGATLFAITG